MAFYDARLLTDSVEDTSYKKRISIVNAIIHFIYKFNKQSLSDNDAIIEHTDVDIPTIRAMVLDFMGQGFCCPRQDKIGDKIGYKRNAVGRAISRLEEAGIIYKIVRFRDKKTQNQHSEFQGLRKTTLGYCLTPNLRSRIYDAMNSGINKLKSVDLSDKIKQINLYKHKVIKKFFNGKIEVEYT